jgi:hypothetical protein
MHRLVEGVTYAIRKVFRGEDAAEALILIDDEHAVSTLGSAELAGLRHGNGFRHGKSRRRLESCDGAFRNAGLSTSTPGYVLGSRDGTLASELVLYPLAESLRRSRQTCVLARHGASSCHLAGARFIKTLK